MKKQTIAVNRLPKVSVVLCDIRSAHNVGAIFRTADAAGVSKIFLCGYTPAPTDRFGRAESGAQKDIAKVALGAEKNIDWEMTEDAAALIKNLKSARRRGHDSKDPHSGSYINPYIVALELTSDALPIKMIRQKIAAQTTQTGQGEIVFVFGNETDGLPEKILKLCDDVAYIPMMGKKESLNVSVAVGVALYTALNIGG